jgi:predicted transcriptional regulator
VDIQVIAPTRTSFELLPDLPLGDDPRDLRRPHRSYIEMRVAILRAVKMESGPTRIMRQANLSWKLLNQFLPGMVARRLIFESKEDGRRLYYLSPSGNLALRTFDLVREQLSEPDDPKVWELSREDNLSATELLFGNVTLQTVPQTKSE